jgi:hypothetical protein
MEREFDGCPLRRTLLAKLNHQRRLAIGALAQLFDDRTALRRAVALRWNEIAEYVAYCDREELPQLMRALHLWRMQSPLSMPGLNDLVREPDAAEYSRN